MGKLRVGVVNGIGMVGILVLTGWILYPQLSSTTTNPETAVKVVEEEPTLPIPSGKLDEAAWQSIVVPHLERCQERIQGAVDENLVPIIEVLNYARNRTAKFSTVALGFGSKWRMVADYVPFTQGGQNETFLREEFESIVLKSSELEQAIELSIGGFLQELESIENQMLVDLRADLEDLPNSPLGVSLSPEELRGSFERTLQEVLAKSNSDFQGAVGSQLVSLIAGEVMAHVAIRMGVSAGILGTGAASGWATFGVGVVVGIVIDSLVSTVWHYWSRPEEDLTRQIQRQLDQMQKLICDGENGTEGLRGQMERIAEYRSQARETALRELLME